MSDFKLSLKIYMPYTTGIINIASVYALILQKLFIKCYSDAFWQNAGD